MIMGSCSESDVPLPALDDRNCSNWPGLCDELLVDILCRLPENLLVRCKCVCKSWRDLITNVCIPRLSAPLSGFICTASTKKSGYCNFYIPYEPPETSQGFALSFSPFMPHEPSIFDFRDCCNGLVLFFLDSDQRYYVCNPLTKQCVKLPRNNHHKAQVPAALAFNPCELPHYKVVCFDSTLNFSIFSSDTGKWAALRTRLRLPVLGYSLDSRCLYLDGALYLLSISRHLVRLDLHELNASALELPDKGKSRFGGFIGLSRGRLHYSSHIDASKLLIWMLEDHRKMREWILVHSICLNDLLEHHIGRELSTDFPLPCALHPTSGVIFLGMPNMIVSYQPDTNELSLVCRMNEDEQICGLVFPYTRCWGDLKNFKQAIPEGRAWSPMSMKRHRADSQRR